MADPLDATPLLLERWSHGDDSALAELVELHLPWLRQQLAHRVGGFLRQRGEPDDYLQDAMLDFLRDAPRFVVPDAQRFRALLARVLENTLRDRNDWFRRKRRDLGRIVGSANDSVLQLDPGLQRSSTPSRAAMRTEVRDWVRLGLELLDPEDRRILVAREYEDRSFVDIADELQMTANAVRMRWVRAIARLTDVLRELRGEAPAPP
ncbi:MAG: sigma-70 family RNA polymerase sigma factor [Planctomycetes bacterium]|nr:sigma-70 family RNA polymerase sigma factor [Planctomycetota bacterium]